MTTNRTAYFVSMEHARENGPQTGAKLEDGINKLLEKKDAQVTLVIADGKLQAHNFPEGSPQPRILGETFESDKTNKETFTKLRAKHDDRFKIYHWNQLEEERQDTFDKMKTRLMRDCGISELTKGKIIPEIKFSVGVEKSESTSILLAAIIADFKDSHLARSLEQKIKSAAGRPERLQLLELEYQQAGERSVQYQLHELAMALSIGNDFDEIAYCRDLPSSMRYVLTSDQYKDVKRPVFIKVVSGDKKASPKLVSANHKKKAGAGGGTVLIASRLDCEIKAHPPGPTVDKDTPLPPPAILTLETLKVWFLTLPEQEKKALAEQTAEAILPHTRYGTVHLMSFIQSSRQECSSTSSPKASTAASQSTVSMLVTAGGR